MRCYCCCWCCGRHYYSIFLLRYFRLSFSVRPCASSSSSSLCDVACAVVVIITAMLWLCVNKHPMRRRVTATTTARDDDDDHGGDDIDDDAREMRIRKRNNARWRGNKWSCIRRHTINSQECFENVVNAPSVLTG